MTGSLRKLSLAVALPIVGAGLGLLIAVFIGAPAGSTYSCNVAAQASQCRRPKDNLGWALSWTIGGLVVGVILAVLAWLVMRKSRLIATDGR
jgi:hypothetical protein